MQQGEIIMLLTTRENSLLKRAWVSAAFTLAIALITAMPASAEAGQEEAEEIVGCWRVTATVESLQGIPPFPVLMTFQADGTMSQSRLYFLPTFGVITTEFHGEWKRIHEHQIATTSFSLAQGAPGNTALNGAFFGTEKVSFQPVIAPDGNSFTAQWTSIVFDPSGSPIIQSNGSLSGVRIRMEP
jgi:hypothetical protein